MSPKDNITHVKAAITGDEHAFGQLVLAHQRTVIGITYALTQSQVAVDDLVQDVFLVAWKNLKTLEAPEFFTAWLCTIARNLSKNWIRSEVYRRALAKAYAEETHENAMMSSYRQLMQSERYAHLRTMLKSVSSPLREVVVLFYFEDFSIKEIAEVLEITPSNAKKRLKRGRNQLRDYFEQDWKAHFDTDAPSDEAVSNKLIATLTIGPAMPLSAYLPSGSLAAIPSALPLSSTTSTLWKGLITMSTKKGLITASIIILCALGILYWNQPKPPENINTTTALSLTTPNATEIDSDSSSAKVIIQPLTQDSVTAPEEIQGAVTKIDTTKNKRETKNDKSIISTISGTIYDEWGAPVPNAEVKIALSSTLPNVKPGNTNTQHFIEKGNPENQYSTTTNAIGEYAIAADFENTTGRVIARSDTAKGSITFELNQSRSNKSMDNINVTINEGVFLIGQVLSPNNSPIPDAYIKNLAFINGAERSALSGSMDYAITDSNGIFELLYPSYGTAGIHILSSIGQTVILDIPVGSPDIIPLHIQEPGTLSGTISHKNGSPAD